MQKERNATEDGGYVGHRTASSKLRALYQESFFDITYCPNCLHTASNKTPQIYYII